MGIRVFQVNGGGWLWLEAKVENFSRFCHLVEWERERERERERMLWKLEPRRGQSSTCQVWQEHHQVIKSILWAVQIHLCGRRCRESHGHHWSCSVTLSQQHLEGSMSDAFSSLGVNPRKSLTSGVGPSKKFLYCLVRWDSKQLIYNIELCFFPGWGK